MFEINIGISRRNLRAKTMLQKVGPEMFGFRFHS